MKPRIDFTKAYTSTTKLELFQLAKEYFRLRGFGDDRSLYEAIYQFHLRCQRQRKLEKP